GHRGLATRAVHRRAQRRRRSAAVEEVAVLGGGRRCGRRRGGRFCRDPRSWDGLRSGLQRDRLPKSTIAMRLRLPCFPRCLPIAVWGRKESRRTAYGTTTAVPVRGKTVAADLTLTACTPGCQGDMLLTCTGAPKNCQLGCSEDGDAHCLAPSASNGVDVTLVD